MNSNMMKSKRGISDLFSFLVSWTFAFGHRVTQPFINVMNMTSKKKKKHKRGRKHFAEREREEWEMKLDEASLTGNASCWEEAGMYMCWTLWIMPLLKNTRHRERERERDCVWGESDSAAVVILSWYFDTYSSAGVWERRCFCDFLLSSCLRYLGLCDSFWFVYDTSWHNDETSQKTNGY